MDHPPHDDADTLRPGTVLGRYEIRRLVGRGGMGSVYEAVHRDLKKRVAVKTLLPALAVSPEAKARFLREGEAASRIRHPHVVDVTDLGAEGAVSYLVMEYLEGEDLSKVIERQGGLSPSHTIDIMLPVAAAIQTAHDQGVIHRDLKPENIFLCSAAYGGVHPKVLDFGISKVTGDGRAMALTGSAATFGTAYYLPPEQIRGAKQADARSDQYALGTILYECLSGARPFQGETLYAVLKCIAEGSYVPLGMRAPELPAGIEEVVARAMSLDPNLRYESVRELGAALLEYASANARMYWAPFFRGTAAAAPLNRASAISGRTMMLPKDGEAQIGLATTPLPPTARPASGRISASLQSNTTLGTTAGESLEFGDGAFDPPRSRKPLVVIGSLVAVAAAAYAGMQLFVVSAPRPVPPALVEEINEPQRAAPQIVRVEITAEPRHATIELDGRPAGRNGVLSDVLRLDGTEHTVVARAPGYEEATLRFTDEAPPRTLTLQPLPQAVSRPAAPPSTRATARPTTSRRERGERRRRDSGDRTSRRSPRVDVAPPPASTTPARPRNMGPNDSPIILE